MMDQLPGIEPDAAAVEAVEGRRRFQQAVSERVSIEAIRVGERVREEYGDLVEMMQSIESVGLIHAVVVDEEYRLLCGGRRLAALKSMGEKEVDVRRFLSLSAKQKKLMELEENRRRKDLTPYEWAKTLHEKAAMVREVASETEDLSNACSVSPTHRPVDKKSREQVSLAIGVTGPTLSRAEQHVETAESYPFMRRRDWSQAAVLQAAKQLAGLPEEHRRPIGRYLEAREIPAVDGAKMLANFAASSFERRQEIIDRLQGSDVRQRQTAETTLAEKPPMPDFRLPVLVSFLADLNRCVKGGGEDAYSDRIKELRDLTRGLVRDMEGALKNGR